MTKQVINLTKQVINLTKQVILFWRKPAQLRDFVSGQTINLKLKVYSSTRATRLPLPCATMNCPPPRRATSQRTEAWEAPAHHNV